MAGLKCRQILDEPTAAALTYGVDHRSNEVKKLIIFDFGGGTLDVSILKIKE